MVSLTGTISITEEGILTKQENITHVLNVHERCGTPVELIKTKQWFIKVLEAKDALLAQAEKMNWYPAHMKQRYIDWVKALKWEWCISRRRYYGVPFPIWYCRECGEIILPDEADLPVDPTISQPKIAKCPKCGSGMIIKLSRGGKFYSCINYPDCDGALMLDGTELKGPKETGEMCPLCGEKKGKSGGGKLIIKERRDGTGTFISCSRYPKCKFIKKDEAEEAKKRTGVICPLCKKGDISERRGRFGIFYSCSNYPDCKFAIKAKPTGRICDKCGSLMMEGTKTIPERCSNNKCPNNRPDKLNKIK